MRINQGTRPRREASPRRGRAHLEPLVPGPFEETRRESIFARPLLAWSELERPSLRTCEGSPKVRLDPSLFTRDYRHSL